MIGNDPEKDLPAHQVGIRTFLVDLPDTREKIEAVRKDERLDGWGNFGDLQDWLRRSAEESCKTKPETTSPSSSA